MTASPLLPGTPVVVGVDGSTGSIRAAVYAAGVARRRSLPLQLVHVTPWQGEGPDGSAASPEVGAMLREGAELLVRSAATAVEEATGLSDVPATVLDGYPVDVLRSLSQHAGLLVLGNRGAGGVTGLLVGSTATGVVQHAHCPVVVLPEDSEEVPERSASVVVGVEGGTGDAVVLAFAFEEAVARGAELIAVHAWRDVTLEAAVGGYGPLVDWASVEADEQRLVSEALAGWRDKAPDVEVREVVVRARPATALLEASAAAELLVLGHRHRNVLARLGSTTHGVLHRASCPVAVVPLGREAR